MSSTVRAPYIELGPGGDYPIEMNYAIRIYTNPPQSEKIPKVGDEGATLKGGQRTNFHGLVPILDGDKKPVGWAEVTKIVSARPEFMPIKDIEDCGFETIEEAVSYAKREHGEEFERDGVLTVFHYRVNSLNNL
ncbi:MAG: hypothetical protein KIH89_002030 [Candidatus Shapirobacteria bacterium]|nr:hypothetical protein [Candidatus Shapirobacteria bacterium]